jgi:hypothetical protein
MYEQLRRFNIVVEGDCIVVIEQLMESLFPKRSVAGAVYSQVSGRM